MMIVVRTMAPAAPRPDISELAPPPPIPRPPPFRFLDQDKPNQCQTGEDMDNENDVLHGSGPG
jgi:hypothetical protein